MTVNKWSTTAASNNTADSTINLREGQAPSSLNDAARGMMAAVAKLRDDLGGKSITAGTSTVYTLTSNQVFAALADGLIVGFELHTDCGPDPDINVDGLGAVDLIPYTGGTFAAAELKAGAKYIATYDATGPDWIVHGAIGTTGASLLAKLLTVDGAGSGLDADLLDGQSSAYYQTASGYTAADVLSKLLTVDGAGSGLDADLLDGQSSAYYQTASGYTAADVLAKLLTVDGVGSGLDADLLDGQSSAYYTAITDRLGYAPVQQGTGTGQSGNAVKIGWNGSSALLLQVDAADFGASWPINVTGSAASATNYTAADVLSKLLTVDGAGSGLDADLLDGQSSAYYLPAGSYTAADVLSKLVTVDGAGSGLDADLLDGQSSAYYAPVASPALTGTPTAPTATVGTSTTQIATTAFVQSNARRLGGVWTMDISGAGVITNIVAVEAVGGTLSTTGADNLRFTLSETRTRRTPYIVLLSHDEAGTDSSRVSFSTGVYDGTEASLMPSATVLDLTISTGMRANGTIHITILD